MSSATSAANSAYTTLERRFARIASLRDAIRVLHWDQSVIMPAGGADARAGQLATLRGVAHEQLVAADMPALLAAAGGEALDDWQAANLREMRRRHGHAAAVPPDLVEAISRATTRCEMAWREARARSDFPALLPSLREVVGLIRKQAAARAAALGLDPYDALLDEYDPGRRAADIDRIFAALEGFLPEMVGRVMDRQAAAPAPLPLDGPFALDVQKRLGERLAAAAGFDFRHGRLDISLHPFTSGVPDDVRITTRYREDDFAPALMGVLHEVGHALYEAGLPAAWRLQPVGEDAGMAIHESQSLVIEMQASRSAAFAGFLAGALRDAFAVDGPAWTAENLHRHQIRVEPGFIRVDADEVTYPAHIILRYRLERAMIAGDLDPADLPGAWNDGMRGLLGITPPDDRLGCLQDIHWPDGSFGYFPTYTLGALGAAQLYAAASAAEPGLEDALGRGEFGPLVRWLRTAVHARGALLAPDVLIEAATGRPLDPLVFKAHLERRYLS